MKKIILALLLLCSSPAFAQEITEENYRREDDLLWERYDREELSEEEADRQNLELAKKYSTTPGGFKRLFMLRNYMPKEELRALYDAVPEELRLSQVGRNILAHLDTKQLEIGDRYHDFEAVTDKGEPFRLSQLEGRNILFIYGGLGCMGSGIEMWKKIYAATSRDDFEIVVLSQAGDAGGLKQERVWYPNDFIIVGDFLGDASPGKIVYGGQGTPTYVFIDRNGVVQATTMHPANETYHMLDKVVVNEVLDGDNTLMQW
jgi:hypothetical protein